MNFSEATLSQNQEVARHQTPMMMVPATLIMKVKQKPRKSSTTLRQT